MSPALTTSPSSGDVPLMVTRGYPSLTYLFEAAEALAQQKPEHLYYFGDYDPSGMDTSRKVEHELRRMAPHVEILFSRVAVTREQIRELDLPTRPTKTTDSRAKAFGQQSVEVDTILSRVPRELVRDCVERRVDRLLGVLMAAEESERALLASLSELFTAPMSLENEWPTERDDEGERLWRWVADQSDGKDGGSRG